MNMVQKAVQRGGKITSLIIPKEDTLGTGLMNPSLFVDDDGDLLCILRHINYTLYHSENEQRFPSVWGPLSYLHPEDDMHLRTTNYLCRLDKDLNIVNYTKIDTSKLDVTPIWEFVGLEDARLVKWGGKYYATGVRRDTTTNGQGRMELSELEIDKDAWTAKEISRVRIEAPNDKSSYCEKNWMPILDNEYQYIKWTSPTEVVQASPDTTESKTLSIIQGAVSTTDQRGGSPVIKWGEYYIAITHEVVLFKNYLKQKNGTYKHRLCVWDSSFKLIGLSPESWSFLDAQIEFCCGAAIVNNNLILGFGYSDNAAFALEVPTVVVEDMIKEALTYGK
jgi:predicted GH43/DUF377 family glycosyl hydrolase